MKQLLALALLLLVLSPAGSLLAQTATPSATPLSLGQMTTGTLSKANRRVTYHLTIPADQDVLIEFAADHIVVPMVCSEMQITVQSQPVQECPAGGGGGDGDGAVRQTLFIPTVGAAAAVQMADITLLRPDGLDDNAIYTLIPHLITPQPLTFSKLTPNAPQPNNSFQSYTLHINSATPFTLDAEENTYGGAFLWAVYQPYKPDVITYDNLLHPAQIVDGANAPTGSALERLALYYLGGDTFRALVVANADYSLFAAPIAIPSLGTQQSLSLALSYRQPVKAVRLTSTNANLGATTLTLNVTQGNGALVWIYSNDQSYPDTQALGVSGDGSSPLQLSATLNFPASAFSRLIVVQIPSGATRNAYTVSVRWEPQ